MAGNTLDAAHINAQIAQDSIYMIDFYHWLKTRYQVWNENAGNATQLTTAGVTVTTDQNQIIAVIGDMNRLITMYEGTAAASTENVIFDLSAVRGCN